MSKNVFATIITGSSSVTATTKTTTSSSSSLISGAVSGVSSWISSLKDAVLKADFTTFSSAGSITEVEMTKALTDLAAELTSSKTTLSSNQLADLKSIAANIGSMGASSYLQFITNAFVNGNAANATWTGGASPIALGNLAAGYTVTKLNELIGDWFLGTNLPSRTVSMSGYSSFNVTYTTVTSPLYGPSGAPTVSDVNQGYLGDCYLLAALAEVAAQDPSIIESMITDNGNGTYGVRFYVNGAARYVTVDTQLADGGTDFNSAPNIWASVIEEAYAEVQAQGVITGNSVNYGNSFTTIGNGGYPEYTLEEITGATAITDFVAKGTSWSSYVYNQSLKASSSISKLATASVLSTLAADLLVGDDIVLSSYTNATDSMGYTTLVAGHAMSIYGYDASTGMVDIRNPWGSESGQYWDTTFEVSLNTLLSAGDTITSDNAGTATTVSGASIVAAPALQKMTQVTSFSVTDTVAQVNSGFPSLLTDTKLSSVTVNGTTSADSLTLKGLKVAATINMNGNGDTATVAGVSSTGLNSGKATSINLGNKYDTIVLGSGSAIIDFDLGSAGGVESVSYFNSAYDLLSVNLNGGSLEQTLVNGGDWISSSTDLTHGVFLASVTSLQNVTVSGGIATVA